MDSYGLKANGFQHQMEKNSIHSSYGLLWSHMDSYGLRTNERFLTSHEKLQHIKLKWTLMGSYGLLWAPMDSYELLYDQGK